MNANQIADNLHSEAILPIVRANVTVGTLATRALVMEVDKGETGAAKLTLDFWLDTAKELRSARAATEKAMKEIRSLVK